MNIVSVVPIPGIKPNCISSTEMIDVLLITFAI